MIPAKISNLNPVQVTYYESILITYGEGLRRKAKIMVISEVDNICKYDEPDAFVLNPEDVDHEDIVSLSLNQSCQIEPTTEGKCRILKLN
jgi:hypothetical protein